MHRSLQIFLGLVALFFFNVIVVALDAPWYVQPFAWLAWGAWGVRLLARWLGDHVGLFYTALADLLTHLWEHLAPALKQSLRQLGDVVLVGGYASWDFLQHFQRVLYEYRAVQALIHPYSLFVLSLLLGVLFLYLTVDIWPFALLWTRMANVLASVLEAFVSVDTRVRMAVTEAGAERIPVPKPTTKRSKHASIGVVGRRDEDEAAKTLTM